MATMDAISDRFDSKLVELKHAIEHHVEEAEGEMFPLVTNRMSSEMERIGHRIHDRKMNLKTQLAA